MAETLNVEQKGMIEDFKAKAQEFWRLWEALEMQGPVVAKQTPATQAEYNDLLQRGETIRGKIEFVTGLIDKAVGAYKSVKDWFSEKFGMGDLSYYELQGLGVIPLIPIAVISAAVAAIGYWINDAYQFMEKLQEIKRLEARGIPPAKAAEIVERTLGKKGLFAGAGNLILPLALGAGVLFMLRK